MSVEVQIALGLAAAFGWGIGDFLSREPTGRLGTHGTILGVGLVGTVATGGWFLLTGQSPPQAPWTAWALAALLGLANIGAGYLIFRAFYEGPISLTSPISASYAAVTFVLGLLTGERAGPLALLGLLLVLTGVPLAATPPRRTEGRRPLTRGVWFAVGAASAYGIIFWAYKYVTPVVGEGWVVLVARGEAVLVIGALLALRVAAFPRGGDLTRAWTLAVIVGVLDTIALLSVTGGTSGGEAVVVVAVSSAYSVVTVAIAMTFLKERLALHQWTGVALTLLGILLVSVGS